jgi:hypothetical protein
MRNIEVDEEVYEHLKEMAEPFVDSTPNDVLRRVLLGSLSSNDEDTTTETRYDRGEPQWVFRSVNRTPDRDFREPILRALQDLGGRAPTVDILERVLEIMRPSLKPIDFEPMRSGQIRWRSAANFEKKHMALEKPALINANSPRGIWEITEDGRRYLKEESPA